MKRLGSLLLLLSLGLFVVGCTEPTTPPAGGNETPAAGANEEGGGTETPVPDAGAPAGEEKPAE